MTLKNKYIGVNKIVKVGDAGLTYLGKSRVKLDFDDGSLELPKEIAVEIATEKPEQDAAVLQNKRIRPVVSKIMVLLTEAELNRDDIQELINTKLPNTIFEANKLAKEKLWGKKDYEITLFDIDKILKKDENNTNK